MIFRLTRWNTSLEREPNDWFEDAQEIVLPAVVEGKVARLNDPDFYRFHAKAGERLGFNMMMARNSLPGNVVITLLGASGRELARNLSRFGPDPYLNYTFEKEGSYVLAIAPRRFPDFFSSGRDDQPLDFRYQLAIGRSPMLWSLFPMGARRGTSIEAELWADFLDSHAAPRFFGNGLHAKLKPTADPCRCKFKLSIDVAKDADLGLHHLTFPDDSGNVMTLAFVVSDEPEIVEVEPNGQEGQAVQLPVIVNGRIDSADDRDNFRFVVDKEEEELTFVISARGLGSHLTDPYLALVRGELVANGDDRTCIREAGFRIKCPRFYEQVGTKEKLDPKFSHTFLSAAPNDADALGEYTLQVMDMSMGGGEGYGYRLTIGKKRPAFRMGLLTDHVNAPLGGVAKVPVVVNHEEGFKGDIEITVENLPPGLKAKPLTIGYGTESAALEILDDDRNRRDELAAPIRIAGTAKLDDRVISQVAVLPPVVSESGPAYSEVPRTDLRLSLVRPPLFSLGVAQPPEGFELSLDQGQVEIPVTISRVDGFDSALVIEGESLPNGVSLKSAELSPGPTKAQVVLVGDRDSAKPGNYRVGLRAVATLEGREIIEVTSAFRLKIE
ncbi:MAG: hypothetical protein L0338_32000 [Acidobacteria bacterium]|nr:hypothetical protein [Acidobacteriota bacterium]